MYSNLICQDSRNIFRRKKLCILQDLTRVKKIINKKKGLVHQLEKHFQRLNRHAKNFGFFALNAQEFDIKSVKISIR